MEDGSHLIFYVIGKDLEVIYASGLVSIGICRPPWEFIRKLGTKRALLFRKMYVGGALVLARALSTKTDVVTRQSNYV